MRLRLLKKRKSGRCLSTPGSGRLTFSGESASERYLHSDAVDVDEVMFCVLDSMLDGKTETLSAATTTVLRFARLQQDFTVRSILYFLEVQKTTETHQHALLTLLRKCITQPQEIISADLMRDILVFILKELNFLKASDMRHSVMVEMLKETAVLYPAFSVEVILAFIVGMYKETEFIANTLCTYVRVLSYVFDKAANNEYIKGVSLIGQIVSLYDESTVCADSGELCKSMVSLLGTLSRALFTIQDEREADDSSNIIKMSRLCNALSLTDTSYSRFSAWHEEYRNYSPSVVKPETMVYNTMSVQQFSKLVDESSVSDPDVVWSARSLDDATEVTTARRLVVACDQYLRKNKSSCRVDDRYRGGLSTAEVEEGFVEVVSNLHTNSQPDISARAVPISFPMRPSSRACDLQSVIDPLYSLLVEKSLPSLYAQAQHADTCLELLNSLALLSKHVSETRLSMYAATVLDSIVVRFYQYLNGTPYRIVPSQNPAYAWMTLHRESNDTYRNKLATIFSSIGAYGDKNALLPPPSLVMCLWSFCKVLLTNNEHILLRQTPNICEVLFGLLLGLHSSGKLSLLTLCDSSLVSHSSDEDELLLNCRSNTTFLDINSKASCKDFVSTLVCACRFFVSNISVRTYFFDFLFRKALSQNEKEVPVALFMLGWSCSHPSICDALSWTRNKVAFNGAFSTNCCIFWRLIDTLSVLVSKIIMENANPCTTRLILSLINHLSKGEWLTFHCFVDSKRGMHSIGDYRAQLTSLKMTKQVHLLISLVLNLKIFYDMEERISNNTRRFSSRNTKLTPRFFRRMYYGEKLIYLDLGLIVSSSISFERFLLPYSCDLMFIFLTNNLLSNDKKGALTVLRSLYQLLSWECKVPLSSRCSKETLSRMLSVVLLYLHDPINYFGESFSAAKILPHVTKILFGKRFDFSDDIWLKSHYEGLDAYILNYEYGECYHPISGMDHILLHFEKMSAVMGGICAIEGFAETTYPAVDQLYNIAKDIKPPVTTYTSLLKLGNIHPSCSITLYHSLGILHILAMYSSESVDLCLALSDLLLGYKGTVPAAEFDPVFTVNPSLSNLVKTLATWAALTNQMNDKMNYTMQQIRAIKIFRGGNTLDSAMQDDRLFYSHSQDEILQNEIYALRGLIIGAIGRSKDSYLRVLIKVYYSLLTKLPGVGSRFTKFSSATFGDDLKPIVLTAMGYMYARAPRNMLDEQIYVTDSASLSEMGNNVDKQMEAMTHVSDESHLLEMYNGCFHAGHIAKVTEVIPESVMLLRCIAAPMLHMCLTDNDPLVQLALSRSLLIALRNVRRLIGVRPPFRFPVIVLERMLYFISNPSLKEIAQNQVYDTGLLEEQYSHLYCRERKELDFSKLKAVEPLQLKPIDSTSCSNVSFSYFCATSLLSESLLSDENSFTTIHIMLAFGDCFRSPTAKQDSNMDKDSECLSIDDLAVRTISYGLHKMTWQRLSHILTVTLFLSDTFPKDLVTYRVSLIVAFLRNVDFSLLPEKTVDNEQHTYFVDCILLLWAHMICLEQGNGLKVSLCEYIKKALETGVGGVQSGSGSSDLSVVEDMDRIDLLLPKESLMISLLRCMKYLSAASCISGSFAVILQLILQQRYADLDHKHLESILTTIFDNFASAFEAGNVPLSLHNFVIDLAKTDFGVLCNVIFPQNHNYGKTFMLSVLRLITSEDCLMMQVLDFFGSLLLSQYSKQYDCKYSVPIDFMVDFVEAIYISSDSQIHHSEEGIRFMINLSLRFVSHIKPQNQESKELISRFKTVVEGFIPKDVVIEFHGFPPNTVDNIKLNLFTDSSVPSNTLETTSMSSSDVKKLVLCLILSVEGFKLPFLRFVEKAVNNHSDFKPLLLRLCMSLFCTLLREGAFKLYSGLVLCLIHKITLFKELKRYYYRSVHYYLQRVELKPMGIYSRQLISLVFKSRKGGETEVALLRKPSLIHSVGLRTMKRCILDRLIISLLDDLASPMTNEVLYGMQRAAASLIQFVCRNWNFRLRNFKSLISRLLRDFSVLIRSDRRILHAFSKLYLEIAKWLDACVVHRVFVPVEIQRHLIPPLGLLILHRSVSTRSEMTCRKLIQILGTLIAAGREPFSPRKSSFSWLRAVLIRIVLSSSKKKKHLCMCGCNNPGLSHFKDTRFCICNAFYLLDLFSSCFPAHCWNIDHFSDENIDVEIERIKKDDHMTRTSQVLFRDLDASPSDGSTVSRLVISNNKMAVMDNEENGFFDLNEVYSIMIDDDWKKTQSRNSTLQMFSATSMHSFPLMYDKIDIQDGSGFASDIDGAQLVLVEDSVKADDRDLVKEPKSSFCNDKLRIAEVGTGDIAGLRENNAYNGVISFDEVVSARTDGEDGGSQSYQDAVSVSNSESMVIRRNFQAAGSCTDAVDSQCQTLSISDPTSSISINQCHEHKNHLGAGASLGNLILTYNSIMAKEDSCKSETLKLPRIKREGRNRELERGYRRIRRRKVDTKRNINHPVTKILASTPCLPSMLSLLTIADFQLGRDGTFRRINTFNPDRLNSTKSGDSQQEDTFLTFFDVSDLNKIRSTTLYDYPTVYRFMLVRKYLSRDRLYPSIMAHMDEQYDKRHEEYRIMDEVVINAVRGVVAILHMSIIHLSKESEILRDSIRAKWPHCTVEMARYNAILHFEALSRAATKQLCKMLEEAKGRMKVVLLESMELLAIVRSVSLTEEGLDQ